MRKFEPESWKRIYAWITSVLPLNFRADELPSRLFSGLVRLNSEAVEKGYELLEGREAAVLGAGPELSLLESVDVERVVAADAAAFYAAGKLKKPPHVLVTDLDGIWRTGIEKTRGIPLIIAHLHGDNIELAGKCIEYFEKNGASVIYTVQTDPVPPFFNFGGFTDGDRAVFASLFFGARKILVYAVGERSYPPGSSMPSDLRARKFWIGKSIIEWLTCTDERVILPLSKGIDCSKFPWEVKEDESWSEGSDF